ncbi:MAG: 30S ribosomal protein S6 [Candidatus Coatesbacteria bacterium]|nr:30S ribosomal protein S6 [Candidatus Coatesbacteria bacterium]
MRAYELVYALRPNLTDEERVSQIKRFEELAKRLGCARVSVEEWGMKRTAYELKKFHEAYYVIMRFFSDPAVRDEIERQLKLTDEVLRLLFVRLEDAEKSMDETADLEESEGSKDADEPEEIEELEESEESEEEAAS